MASLIPSALALGSIALVAVWLARGRPSPDARVRERAMAARWLAIATLVQAVHFLEETATGLPERLPALFGAPAMPLWFFVVFNAAWLVVWAMSIPGLRAARPAAFFAAWFLAIAGMFNGVAHPLLAVAAGSYFPGLVTSPLIGVVCLLFTRRLAEATRPAQV